MIPPEAKDLEPQPVEQPTGGEASVRQPAAQPPVVEQPTVELVVDGVSITLLGTAHVSRTSAQTVAEMIASRDYDSVAIELDAGRLAAINDTDAYAKTDLMQVLRSGRAGVLAVNLALGAFQQRLADQFGIEPGAEMRAAVTGAKEQGLPLVLIDRDIGVTLRRLYASVGWWQRMVLLSGLLASTFTNEKIDEEEIEKLKEGDILEATFSEFAERSESLYRPLIAERDQYMAIKLRQHARTSPDGHRVLAIVGAGHLKGIKAALLEAGASEPGPAAPGSDALESAPVEPAEARGSTAEPAALRAQLSELETTPPPSRWTKAIPWLILVLVLAGFAVGFWRSPETGLQLLTDWTLITAGLAGLGTLIALAHPVTILATMVAAPFTTLNPVLGAGFVAAGVELWLRKPNVGDFERLRKDVTTWRGWWTNRAARVLLVFVLSTIGASSGTFLASARIFGRLFG